MSTRRCWTCNADHDIDEACKQSGQARAERAAGGTNSALFGGVPEDGHAALTAKYDGRCPACDDEIHVGDSICRVDGQYVHEECAG